MATNSVRKDDRYNLSCSQPYLLSTEVGTPLSYTKAFAAFVISENVYSVLLGEQE
jgi:hypothetical protein